MAGADVLDALVDLLAERVAEKLADRLAPPSAPPDLASARNNPLGSGRAFLDAARAGRFESWRRGREVVARWSDVAAYDRARLRPRPAPSPAPADPDAHREAVLRRAGLLPKG